MYVDYQLLLHYMKQLEQQIIILNQNIESLQTRIDQLENQESRRTSIEKIEYNFDQLKIEQLDGMLQIGLSPEQLKQLDEFTVPTPTNDPSSQIEKDLQEYTENHLSSYIKHLEEKYKHSLTDEQRRILLDDVQSQLKERVAFHLKSYDRISFNEEKITDSIIQEIEKGIDKWFHNH